MKSCIVVLSSIAGALGVAGLDGCAHYTPVRMDVAADTSFKLVWPLPPDPPRIQYLRTIALPSDIGVSRSVFGRMADFVFGGGTEERIRQPYGVAVDDSQRIYVADQAAKAVHVFETQGAVKTRRPGAAIGCEAGAGAIRPWSNCGRTALPR